MSHLSKYLARYAETEAALATELVQREKPFKHCLVIPVYRESSRFLQRLITSYQENTEPVCVILVINSPNGESTNSWANALFETLGKPLGQIKHLSQYQLGQLCVITVSRLGNHGIPADQGVGLARKIGCDCALALISTKALNSPWIHQTDADAILPENYFEAIAHHQDTQHTAAFIHPHCHRTADTRLQLAANLYDRKLHQYAEGLKYANSPYAYIPMGSTLVVSARHYAMVRGFPPRSAAEDFYLLNKLAKVGLIVTLSQSIIILNARCSNRVPMGTGIALEKLLASDDPNGYPMFYDQRIFCILKEFLRQASKCPTSVSELDLPSATIEALTSLRIERFFAHVTKQNVSGAHFCKQFHTWFDSFRTLKLINHLSTHKYPRLSAQNIIRP